MKNLIMTILFILTALVLVYCYQNEQEYLEDIHRDELIIPENQISLQTNKQ